MRSRVRFCEPTQRFDFATLIVKIFYGIKLGLSFTGNVKVNFLILRVFFT